MSSTSLCLPPNTSLHCWLTHWILSIFLSTSISTYHLLFIAFLIWLSLRNFALLTQNMYSKTIGAIICVKSAITQFALLTMSSPEVQACHPRQQGDAPQGRGVSIPASWGRLWTILFFLRIFLRSDSIFLHALFVCYLERVPAAIFNIQEQAFSFTFKSNLIDIDTTVKGWREFVQMIVLNTTNGIGMDVFSIYIESNMFAIPIVIYPAKSRNRAYFRIFIIFRWIPPGIFPFRFKTAIWHHF